MRIVLLLIERPCISFTARNISVHQFLLLHTCLYLRLDVLPVSNSSASASSAKDIFMSDGGGMILGEGREKSCKC